MKKYLSRETCRHIHNGDFKERGLSDKYTIENVRDREGKGREMDRSDL